MFSDDSDLMVFPARDAAFTVRTRLNDGSVSVASRPFEARPDGAQRARIPASEINSDAEWVEIVPFWEIVYHGFVFHPTDRLTQSHTTAPNRKRSPSTWLLSVEFAGRPIAYIEPDTPVEEIKRLCDDWKPLARFDTLFLDEHRRLSATARLIRYSDGTEVVVNYGRRPFAHLGESVPPRSYRVFPPDGAD